MSWYELAISIEKQSDPHSHSIQLPDQRPDLIDPISGPIRHSSPSSGPRRIRPSMSLINMKHIGGIYTGNVIVDDMWKYKFCIFRIYYLILVLYGGNLNVLQMKELLPGYQGTRRPPTLKARVHSLFRVQTNLKFLQHIISKNRKFVNSFENLEIWCFCHHNVTFYDLGMSSVFNLLPPTPPPTSTPVPGEGIQVIFID